MALQQTILEACEYVCGFTGFTTLDKIATKLKLSIAQVQENLNYEKLYNLNGIIVMKDFYKYVVDLNLYDAAALSLLHHLANAPDDIAREEVSRLILKVRPDLSELLNP